MFIKLLNKTYKHIIWGIVKMKKKNLIIVVLIIAILAGLTYIIVNKIQKENKKYEIAQINEYKYFVLKENEKYGVINTEGKTIIEPKYDDIKIPNPEKAVFICYEGESTKVLNNNGEEIYTQYENIQPLKLKNILSDLMYEKTTLKYSKDGKYGIISIDGKKITNAIYEEIDTLQFKEGELLVKKNEKYGVINIKGATLVKALYDGIEADRYYEEDTGYKKDGYIVKKTTDKGYRYGYVTVNGKQIIDNKYNDLYRITDINSDEIYIICAENGKYGLLKDGNKIIENDYQSLVYNESNNTITALKGKNYGAFFIDGKEIIPFEYKQIGTSGEYIYATTADENEKVFDTNGNEAGIEPSIAIIDVDSTDYKIYIDTTNGKTNYEIYQNDKKITKNKYIYIEYLFDNYFTACNEDGKLGVIDNNDETKINFEYNSIQKIEGTNLIETIQNDTNTIQIYTNDMKKVSELKNANIEINSNYIKLYNNTEIKYITKDGKEVKNTELFENNKIFANQKDGKWGFVDKNGKVVIDYKYDDVTEVNKYGFAGIKMDNKWGIVDENGNIVVEPKYKINDNNPTFIGEYYQVTYGSGEVYYTK